MKKFTILVVLFLISQVLLAQFTVSGRLTDRISGASVSGALVALGQTQKQTDTEGAFSFAVDPGSYQLIISAEGYHFHTQSINIVGESVDLGIISLEPRLQLSAEISGIAEIEAGDSDFESSREAHSISGLLQASDDIFVNTAGFTFSSMRFRMRGYDSEYFDIYIGGMLMNKPEHGRPVWSEWGGINDALRNRENLNGLQAGSFGFGSAGGATNITTRASLIRKQNKITYALANRSYNNRITYTYASGLRPDNWAFAVNVSRRWAEEGMVEGTFYDSWSYFLGVERKLDARHSLALSLIGSPYRRGMQGPSVQEVYDLTSNNLYNPNWGYQEGEIRNSRVRKANEPKLILNHFWDTGTRSQLTNTLGLSFGRLGTTALNWYDAPDPRPDYYRYLPGFQLDDNSKDLYTNAWENDEDKSVSQINWNKMYQVNYLANSMGERAKYMLEERRSDHLSFFAGSRYRYDINEYISLNTGVELQHYTGYHFKTVDDLLGGEFWIDVDQFAERDFSGDTLRLINDLENPAREVKEGDRFGYDYIMRQNTARLWSVALFTGRKFDGSLAANMSMTSFWREGQLQNGRYPELSKGKSEINNFTNYGIKAGLTYKITGRHFITGNAAWFSRPPYITNVFTAPRISNKMVVDPNSEKILSGDVSYIHRGTFMNARLTAYQTYFFDQTDVIGFYHDDFRTFVNLVITDIDKVHQGIEIGLDLRLSSTMRLVGAAALGNYVYTSRQTAIATIENGSMPDTSRTVYSKYFYVPGTPQTATSIGLKYAHPKYWFLDLNLNYFDKIYLNFNPERRTERAIENLGEGDPHIENIIKQERLPSGFTLDFSLGKSWRINNSFLGLNFNISNILNNQLKTGGFEQMRFDFANKDIDRFPSKYFYNYGRTYFLMLSLRF